MRKHETHREPTFEDHLAKAVHFSEYNLAKAVHAFCLNCVGDLESEIAPCSGDEAYMGACPLYEYRLGNVQVPIQKIKQACFDCASHDDLVVDCVNTKCAFYDYRFLVWPLSYKEESNSDSQR